MENCCLVLLFLQHGSDTVFLPEMINIMKSQGLGNAVPDGSNF